MKVGIDISPIVYGTGVSDYTTSLVEALLRIDRKDLFVLFGTSLRQKERLREFSQGLGRENVYSRIFPFPPTFLPEYWHRIRFPKIERLTGKIDVYHSSDWVQPPTKAAKITTIHDLFFLREPKTTHPKILATQKTRLAWVKKEVDRIIVVSKATKDDVLDLLKIPEKRIRVIYEAMPTKVEKVESKKIVSKTLEKFGIRGRYILAVGTREPRKNLKGILAAFKLLGEKDLALVIAGRFGWGEDIPPQKNTILTGFVSDLELSVLYQKAACFVYTSLYEGFGQPILEAMYLGCPVVTSDVSSMPEIAGEAAVLVSPRSLEEIAEGIKKGIKEREDLVEKGRRQVKKFSWEKCARETLKVYQELV